MNEGMTPKSNKLKTTLVPILHLNGIKFETNVTTLALVTKPLYCNFCFTLITLGQFLTM